MEMQNKPLFYKRTYKIPSYFTDQNRGLRLSAALHIMQDDGGQHLASFGLPYGFLFDHGMVFILTRMTVDLPKPILFEDTVDAYTWHKGSRGARFYRQHEILSQEGEVLMQCTAEWVLMDPRTRALLRPNVFTFDCPAWEDKQMNLPVEKLRMPDDMEDCSTRLIRYSDIDYNGHVNNATYADMACDLAADGLSGKRVRTFSIAYHQQAYKNETLAMRKREEGDTVWVQGLREGKPCFDAKLTLCDTQEWKF